jgi:hypothetical protein
MFAVLARRYCNSKDQLDVSNAKWKPLLEKNVEGATLCDLQRLSLTILQTAQANDFAEAWKFSWS